MNSPRQFNQKGQALAEFALTLPPLLLLVFGIAQLCLIALAAFFSQYAAHCAARSYAVYLQQATDLAEAQAEKAAQHAMAFCRPKPSFSLRFQFPLQGQAGVNQELGRQILQVDLAANYPLLFPALRPVLGRGLSWGRAQFPLHARVLMQAEDGKDFRRQHPET